MDYIFSAIFLLIVIYGFFSIKQDIETRKVSNEITISLFIFSLFIFLFFIKNVDLVGYISIISIILICYFLYNKDILGAADGKVLISLSLIFISYLSLDIFLYFIINLFLIYLLLITFLTQIKTSLDMKKKVFNKIDYGEIFFTLIFSFILVTIIYSLIGIEFALNNLFIVLISVFALMFILSNFVKKYYLKLDMEIKVFLNIFLFLFFLLLNNFFFQYYFIVIYFLKIIMEYVSELSSKIDHMKKIKYESPFMIYLFLVAIITLISQENILIILIKFFT